MTYVNVSGYKFILLEYLPTLQVDLLKLCRKLKLKGTILLGQEGINLNLSGNNEQAIDTFTAFLAKDERFSDIHLKYSYSQVAPFSKMHVKIRKEIVTMGVGNIDITKTSHHTLSPHKLKQWYEENKEFTILDTRNDYEYKIGTFKNAKTLPIKNFREFPKLIESIKKENKPVVMFCTGGVRCEKAMPWLEEQGINNVYQLQGGILNYFKECGGAYYEGECFVFDDRISLNSNLNVTGAVLCEKCQFPITVAEQQSESFKKQAVCEDCGRRNL